MRILFHSLILLVTTQLYCQDQFDDSIKKVYKNAANFRKTIELSQEASTISGTKFSDYHSGIKKAYLFHGDFQMAITMGGESYVSGKKRVWFHCVQLTPSARIRILQNDPKWDDKSKPVRTPSFNPKVYYFITNQYFWNKKRKIYLGTGIGHHSNGQDGTEFVDFSDTVNIYNGSFSESLINYFVIGGNKNFKQAKNEAFSTMQDLKPNLKVKNKSHLNLNWKVGFEFHPPFFSNQKFHETGVYGGNRVFGNLQLINSKSFSKIKTHKEKVIKISQKRKETHRLSFTFEYITDLSYNSGGFNHLEKIKFTDASKRLNLCLTYYKRILDSKYPALFAQVAYYGSENYNIYFQKSSFQARIGLAFGFFKYEKI